MALYRPHYSETTDLRVVQTRDAIRSAFLELLDSKSLDQITIREIAKKAGIGYNTFFRHHTGKEELLHEIAAAEIKELIGLSLQALDTANTLEASRALCQHVAEHDTLWSTLLTGGAATTLREEFIRRSWERWHQVAAGGISTIKSTEWLPAEIGIRLAAVGTIELLALWLEQSERLPVEQMAGIYQKLVIAPVMEAYAE